jgi:hypothetical protein
MTSRGIEGSPVSLLPENILGSRWGSALVLCGEFCGGGEDGVVGHPVLLDETWERSSTELAGLRNAFAPAPYVRQKPLLPTHRPV